MMLDIHIWGALIEKTILKSVCGQSLVTKEILENFCGFKKKLLPPILEVLALVLYHFPTLLHKYFFDNCSNHEKISHFVTSPEPSPA